MNDTRSILWLGIEDYSGLWEAVWQLHTLHPELDIEALTGAARTILTDLVRRGLVRLYRCQEPYGDLSPVEDGEAAGILASADCWKEPGRQSVSIRFAATVAGEEAYK